jgi:hypothetical protein
MRILNARWVLNYWACLGLALLGPGCWGRAAGSQAGLGPLVGKRAPAFQAQGIFNEPYSLETFKGHILVLQFGASW